MEIKTLAQILAENEKESTRHKKIKKSDPIANQALSQHAHVFEKQFNKKNNINKSAQQTDKLDHLKETTPLATATKITKQKTRRYKKEKKFHPAAPYQPQNTIQQIKHEVDNHSIKKLLAEVKAEFKKDNTNSNTADGYLSDDSKISDSKITNGNLDNLPSALKAYLKTPEQRQAEKEEIKANSRLRWLAFYYLSRREHSADELRQKLIDKQQDPQKVDNLLKEFSEKGYQSDYRTALMLIREGIRKHYGRKRIKNDFQKRKIDMPSNIDELIDMAMDDNEEFADVISDNELVDGVDWLRLAVEARVKKYGNEIPHKPKEMARQLRFLQYRGFEPDICFKAINYSLETLDDRF